MAGFGVTAGDLRVHAGKVDGHAQALGQAVDAANQAMPDDAYGVICQFLPPLFNEVEQAAGEALTASQGALEVVSENLRASAESYESQDEAMGLTFRGIEGGMG
ncbi:MAG TPA: type VII secretion target [Pseudonocardiaceae bacterium]|jgi:hypothetical protein|nr:type VII secretion target [Pseudonocardiaceae bacterium]